jgi:hypothetical protein
VVRVEVTSVFFLRPRASRSLKREARTVTEGQNRLTLRMHSLQSSMLDVWCAVITVRATRFSGRDARGPRKHKDRCSRKPGEVAVVDSGVIFKVDHSVSGMDIE